jgi:DNA (cytosine-5)-methyltransferase 1
MKNYNYIDLFHGIGGFALGAHWAGMKFKNHFCSDIEPYCQKLYKLRFPDSIQLGDITKIDTGELKKYGTDWIITGGFPCQDISIAGRGAGITGARSGLWFEYWRLIRDLRPRFAIMENVGMLVHRGLREVLGSLAEIGYDAEWQDIRASDVGAPHRRERIWIVAYEQGHRRDCPSQQKMDAEANKRKSRCGLDNGGQDVADTESLRGWGIQRYEWKQEAIGIKGNYREQHVGEFPDSAGAGYERQEPEGESRWESGLPAECGWWSVEPDVGRLAHGVPSRVDRLKGLGNAIVPQIAEMLFNLIKPIL